MGILECLEYAERLKYEKPFTGIKLNERGVTITQPQGGV